MQRPERNRFATNAALLARSLLGCTLVRTLDDGCRLAGVIVETEAYMGAEDSAAHSYRRRRTARTEPMFAAGGTAYVYFTYGMHHCMNVVASTEGDPQAVLIRALEPTEGLGAMRRHRQATVKSGTIDKLADHLLCSGPGRICRAMSIDRSFSGLDLTQAGPLAIQPGPAGIHGRAVRESTPGSAADRTPIGRSPRIGLGTTDRWRDEPLRFFVRGHQSVSGRPRR
ncbi:MAG: DNA-3-methyladenine glycosylase [Planctomycetota bacterium]